MSSDAPSDGTCSCQTGQRNELSPDTAVGEGTFELLSKQVHAAEYYTEWRLACPKCGRRYKVVDDVSYWKPLYHWEGL